MRAFDLRRSLVTAVAVVVAGAAALAGMTSEAEARKRRGGYAPPYASIVIDVNSGKTLQAVNADAPRFPASVTKVMTLYMLFEQIERGRFSLETPLKVSAFAARQAPSKIGFDPGETIEVEDAIKALVTKSANDVAVVVAEAIGGDQETFAEQMTRKARSLGMSRTT
ncbi:MAG: D-alanyl-D-alanine carboxypeptidase family protein, partial [Beijerinckiaceae bacterium]